MPAPTLKKTIGVKCDDANAGETIIIQNETTSEQVTGQLNSGKEILFNESWSERDKLIAVIRGSVTGYKAATVQSGGANIRINATADTSSPGVSL